MIRIIVRSIIIIPAILLLALASLLAVLWIDHTRQTTLPAPTGPFPVGRTTTVWVDPARPAPLAHRSGVPRTLDVWIWYPANSGPAASAEYLPSPWRQALERHSGALLTHFFSRDLSRVRTHSLPEPPVSPRQPSYPVLLMRGGGGALTANYTTLAEDLASHGYIVVGFDVPYRSVIALAADGTPVARTPENNLDLVAGPQAEQRATLLLGAWTTDLGFALDRLTQLNASDPSGRFGGRLDLQRIGVFGHSLGGATALQFCHDDPRCKAGIDVDGMVLGNVANQGLTKPFMFLMSDHSGEPQSETRPIQARIDALYRRLPPGRRWMITIAGADHYGFSDPTRSPLALSILQALGHRLSTRRQISIAEHYIRAFFDVYLEGAPAAALQPQPGYPEARYTP